jgi:Micrococcal nuclease (thermonuclease) homologs
MKKEDKTKWERYQMRLKSWKAPALILAILSVAILSVLYVVVPAQGTLYEKEALESIGYTAREYEDDEDWSGLKGLFPEWEAILDEYEEFVREHKIILYNPEGHRSFIRSSRLEMERLMEKAEKEEKKEKTWLGTHTGKVTKVIDGDTFVLRTDEIDPATGERARLDIRIASLECPEKGEPGYKHATEILEYLILGKRVEVDISKPTGGWGGTTRWLADVTYGGGDLARAMERETRGVCL